MTTLELPSITQINFFDGSSLKLGPRGKEIIKVPDHSISRYVFNCLLEVIPNIDAYSSDTPVKDIASRTQLPHSVETLVNMIKLGHLLGLHFVCKVLGHHLTNIMQEETITMNNANVQLYIKEKIGILVTAEPEDNELYNPESDISKQLLVERQPTDTVYDITIRPVADYVII